MHSVAVFENDKKSEKRNSRHVPVYDFIWLYHQHSVEYLKEVEKISVSNESILSKTYSAAYVPVKLNESEISMSC